MMEAFKSLITGDTAGLEIARTCDGHTETAFRRGSKKDFEH